MRRFVILMILIVVAGCTSASTGGGPNPGSTAIESEPIVVTLQFPEVNGWLLSGDATGQITDSAGVVVTAIRFESGWDIDAWLAEDRKVPPQKTGTPTSIVVELSGPGRYTVVVDDHVLTMFPTGTSESFFEGVSVVTDVADGSVVVLPEGQFDGNS